MAIGKSEGELSRIVEVFGAPAFAVRSVTPPGEIGKVFGFVSIGYNIGGVVAPVMFGYLLDRADPGLLF
ncbi:MAG: hypothetical protein BMS9Abin01_0706 [Gammaproteobacteria bacterium]|nr:MAG: hypothetical protein BMS9Abin01_0706 [Gammaproteobacteria bacterium]